MDINATRRAAAAAFVVGGLGKRKSWADLSYAYDYQEGTMLYLCWFDDNAKHTIEQKIAGAIEAFQARYGNPPDTILVNTRDAGYVHPTCEVRVEQRVSPNNYHLGRSEHAKS